MGLMTTLAGCAPQVPKPQVSAPPMTAQPLPASAGAAKPKPRRQEACKLAHVDLPGERKAALFKQFAAERAGTDGAVAPPPAAPAPSNCRQAAR